MRPITCEIWVGGTPEPTQAPPEHWVWPVPHIVEQLPLLQTCVPGQVTPQLPQLLLLFGTHMLLQERSPEPHLHTPA